MAKFRDMVRSWVHATTRRSALLAHLRLREAIRRTTPRLMRSHGVPHVDIAWRLGSASSLIAGEERFALHRATVHACAAAEGRLWYRVSSLSKPVFALGVLALARDNVLQLDAPLGSLIALGHAPGTPQPAHGITLRLLLAHCAGLAEQNPPMLQVGEAPQEPIEHWLATPEAQRLVQHVDAVSKRTRYSGMGYALAQLAVERKCQELLPAILRRAVLRPLDVESAWEQELLGSAPSRVVAPLAPDHDAQGRVIPACPSVCASSSGLVTSPHELCKLLHRGLFGGFLPPTLASAMLTPQPSTVASALFSVGLRVHGSGENDAGGDIDTRSLTHAGLRPGHASGLIVVPEHEAVLCVATSARAGTAVCKPLTGLFRELFVGA